jgi:hypothetical protein
MANLFFELQRLHSILINKGLELKVVDRIVEQARNEIHEKISPILDDALNKAIESGVEKNSHDFINALMIDRTTFSINTDSGITDFSEPPFPMLPRLLSGAKPKKDGSGVYKVIPVGSTGTKTSVSSNIFDAQKKMHAERLENAKRQYANVSPTDSKGNFRTAHSRQNSNTQWVLPATEKDFTEDLRSINTEIESSIEEIIQETIREYEEGF